MLLISGLKSINHWSVGKVTESAVSQLAVEFTFTTSESENLWIAEVRRVRKS